MPVPEDLSGISNSVRVYPGQVAPGVQHVNVTVSEEAAVADVIEAVLEKLSIPAGTEHFDLIEVFGGSESFLKEPELSGESRILRYFECPLPVSRTWKKRQHSSSHDSDKEYDNSEDRVDNIDGGENSSKSVSTNGEYKFYLRQKKENLLRESNVRVTWLDGLKKTQSADEWHFEPFYREEQEIDDLVDLPVLNESILLKQLFDRFCRGRIYTYVGGILIAVNPFKYFPIYNPKYVKAYQHRQLGELPPHVFAIADAAYIRMLKEKENQCIVISGESGSGKTESTKLILHHLTALSHKTKATVLEKTILAAGPVLEAFGNARTSHNNNSSRFGKFTQVNYRTDGVVCGAVLKKYLLEKSRIVSQGAEERNYHVFYYMLAGATTAEREILHLENVENYYYLNQSQCQKIESVDEAYEFLRLKQAMKNIGLTTEIQNRMFHVLSAVLLIGNIKFKKKKFPDDAVDVHEDSPVSRILALLQIDQDLLVEPLTMRKTVTRGEEFVRLHKHDEAVATRDSMAKCLYGSLFDWIVLQINHTMVARQGRKLDKKAYSIGVLDIFGFEDFEYNSFEQFCINLANENLQFYCNQHIFKLRQEEYLDEGLEWSNVEYTDNSSCLNLMVGKPTGLIMLLDEECSLTIGTDESLLAKFNKHHCNHLCYEMPPTREPAFSIIHYAGTVKYQTKGFRSKNRDLMRSDIVQAFANSRMLFVRELMGADPIAIYYWTRLANVIRAVTIFKQAGAARARGEKMFPTTARVQWASAVPAPSKRRAADSFILTGTPEAQAIMRKATRVMNRRAYHQQLQTKSPSQIREKLQVQKALAGGMVEAPRRGASKSPPTVVAQFHSSLQELMDTLNKSHPFFVRCLRSNSKKAALEFDAELVLRQLRYTGMLDTVKIRQAGYPCRIPTQQFMSQYKILFGNSSTHSKASIALHLRKCGLDDQHFQVGKTKVFMRENQYRLLKESLQKKIDQSAILIQRRYRAHLSYQKFKSVQRSVRLIQRVWRGYQCRRSLHRAKIVRRCQAKWRARRLGRLARERFLEARSAAVLIQANYRAHFYRQRYRKLLQLRKEAREQKEVRDHAKDLVREALKNTIFDRETTLSDGDDTDTDAVLQDASVAKPHDDVEGVDRLKVADKVVARVVDRPAGKVTDKRPKSGVFTKAAGKLHFDGDKLRTDASRKTLDVDARDKRNSLVVMRRRGDTGSSSDSESDEQLRNEKFAQKVIRRLSFTAKDKAKMPAKRSKEFEDEFVVISGPAADDHGHTDAKKATTLNQKVSGFFGSLNRRGSRKEDRIPKSDHKRGQASSTGREWAPEREYIVKGDAELEAINSFLARKLTEMNSGTSKDTIIDTVFKRAVQEYHANLLTTYANAFQRNETIRLKYEDMTNGFIKVLKKIIAEKKMEDVFPAGMGSNLFGALVEEFLKNKESLLKRRPRKQPKMKRKRTAETYDYKGHLYNTYTFNINTYCEFCNSYIYDKGLVCQACNFTCHKKCHTRYLKSCKGRRPSVCGPTALFGTELSELTSPNNPVPLAIRKLMQQIEQNGLYSEGLYRKPGLQASVNNLKSVLTSIEAEDLLLEDEKPHVLASTLKLFFRQLPSPLICCEFYEDFIRSVELDSEGETYSTLYELIQRFPKPNRELLERLIFHLSRVAAHEDVNKMSPNGLAIIWAPCLLRPPSEVDPVESLQQLPQQTRCIEILISEHVKKTRRILDDIDVLTRASSSVEKRLSRILKERYDKDTEEDGISIVDGEAEMLKDQIDDLDEERRRLTGGLATLEPRMKKSDEYDDNETSDDGLDYDYDVVRSDDDLSSVVDIAVSPPSDAASSNMSRENLRPSDRTGSKLVRKKLSNGKEYDSSFEDVSDLPSKLEKASSAEVLFEARTPNPVDGRTKDGNKAASNLKSKPQIPPRKT